MRRPPTHYVRHNKVTRVPRTFVYLDSEAHQRPARGSYVQTFRCAVTACDRRQQHRDGWAEREWADHDSLASLWDWIDARCKTKARTVLVAHKLDYDMRITDALAQLTARGWRLTSIRLDATQAWASWKRETRTLVMCDSLAWVARPLDNLGALVGIPKLALPAWDDSDEAWRARCRRDVEILAEVYRRLIDWVRADDLGNWKPTGAGQAWAAYRHRFMTHRLLVHENEQARAAERVAAWTGRCEAWRWGRVHGGPFTEWDYSTAYARIGADSDVPVRLIGETAACSPDVYAKLTRRFRVLSEVTVTTDTPTVPARLGDRIGWPVGTFATTLWDSEIDLARERGAQVSCGRTWWYARRPAVQAFCEWCLDLLREERTDVDPVVRIAVKHWSRALIGRFGARWSTWEQVGRSPVDDIALGWVHDVSAGERWRMLQLGAQLLRQSAEVDSPDAVVSVMSWIMAECRARLWRSAEVAGLDHVVYVDTDSLIVDAIGHERLREAAVEGLRTKGRWNTLELLGPRQIIAGGALRAAGIPRGAVRVSGDVWEADVWSQFSTSITSGEAAQVRITPRRMRLRGVDRRRVRERDGRTVPHVVDLAAYLVG